MPYSVILVNYFLLSVHQGGTACSYCTFNLLLGCYELPSGHLVQMIRWCDRKHDINIVSGCCYF